MHWILLLAAAALQTPPPTPPVIPANQPFQVVATHNGLNTTNYVFKVDGATLEVHPVTDLKNGQIVMSLPNGISQQGPHSITVGAVNQCDLQQCMAEADTVVPIQVGQSAGVPDKPGVTIVITVKVAP